MCVLSAQALANVLNIKKEKEKTFLAKRLKKLNFFWVNFQVIKVYSRLLHLENIKQWHGNCKCCGMKANEIK